MPDRVWARPSRASVQNRNRDGRNCQGVKPAPDEQSRKQAHIRLARAGTRLAIAGFVANQGSKHFSESTTTAAVTRPVCDEWGVYDPEQAGFEAIIRRLFPEEDDVELVQASPLPRSGAESTR